MQQIKKQTIVSTLHIDNKLIQTKTCGIEVSKTVIESFIIYVQEVDNTLLYLQQVRLDIRTLYNEITLK